MIMRGTTSPRLGLLSGLAIFALTGVLPLMPGRAAAQEDVKKEEIKVHVQEGVLTIEGERKQQKEEQGKRFHKIEREYGRFVRRFALPIEVDADKVRAEFKDGVLTVAVPKAPAVTPKMIDVKVL